jgi:ribosomal protein S18 acetylase RimI-like enzyme
MIREIVDQTELPWELLLNADPNRAIVETYISESRVFIAENETGDTLGVLALLELTEPHQYEIMNVSVKPQHFRQGIGKALMTFAITELLSSDAQAEIIIKTGDLTDYAIALYQSVGFEIVTVVKDYFIDNYAEPIYEHGQLLRNQVIMRLVR